MPNLVNLAASVFTIWRGKANKETQTPLKTQYSHDRSTVHVGSEHTAAWVIGSNDIKETLAKLTERIKCMLRVSVNDLRPRQAVV